MLYSRWMQQNYAGGGNQGGDTGYGGYDQPTAGPDSGNGNPGNDYTPAPRPVRPRPQPSAPARPRTTPPIRAQDRGRKDQMVMMAPTVKATAAAMVAATVMVTATAMAAAAVMVTVTAMAAAATSRRQEITIDHPVLVMKTPESRGAEPYSETTSTVRAESVPIRTFSTRRHIGADGKTRQRGESIHEDGIISTKNTVQDGEGHLQLFPVRQRTYDEVGKEYVNYYQRLHAHYRWVELQFEGPSRRHRH